MKNTPIYIALLCLGLFSSLSSAQDKGAPSAPPLPTVQAGSTATPAPENSAWPKPEDASWRDGALADKAALRLLRAGQTKDQVRQALGVPHFGEGIFGSDQWHYKLVTGTGNECLLKVSFDSQRRVRALQWQAPTCANAYPFEQ